MTQLSVNINKVALLRNQRDLDIPSVSWAAKTCIEAGAYGITIHPRPDERHIRYDDVYQVKPIVKSAGVEFNIEGNPCQGRFMEIMPDILPTQATLVPDSPDANTSDHGWNLLDEGNCKKLIPIIEELKNLNIRTSLFVDPAGEIIEKAKEIGADRIELYTEPYASACLIGCGDLVKTIEKYSNAAKIANDVGLGVNAGHDLNLHNLKQFCKLVKPVMEVSIGHALIADALKIGLEQAVKDYLKILADI